MAYRRSAQDDDADPPAPARRGDCTAETAACVHQLAAGHYSSAQCATWAPANSGAERQAARIRHNQHWFAEDTGKMLGFSDLPTDDHIEMRFFAPTAARRGVGTALLQFLIAKALPQGMPRLTAHVSLNAENLFRRQGFALLRRQVERDGVMLANADMYLLLE